MEFLSSIAIMRNQRDVCNVYLMVSECSQKGVTDMTQGYV